MFRSSSFKKNIDSIIAAITGFIIIFLFTRHGGIGIEPDSVVYISAAENFHSTGKLIDFSHKAVVEFPAFYPLFLSIIMWLTRLKPLVFLPIVNAGLFACIIFLSGYIIEYFSCRSRWYKMALLSCIVFSPALLEVYSMTWSETVFILLLLLFIISIRSYLQSYSTKTLIITALLASIAAVTRYAGITIIATGGLLLLADMKMPLRKKVSAVFLYTILSSSLLIINLVRNHTNGNSLTGMRERSVTSLSTNIHDTGSVFYDWLPFLHGHYRGAGILVVLLITLFVIILMRLFVKEKRLAGYENIAMCFSVLYLLFMIIIASISRFEQLNSRFLSALFIPLICCSSSLIIDIIHRVVHSNKKWLIIIGTFIFLVFQYGQLSADYETWDGVKDAGIPGYTEDQWTLSPTILFIQKDSIPFKKNYTIYSNANDAIYFFTGRPGKFLPHKELEEQKTEFLHNNHCYVVWFDDGDNPDLVNKDFITAIKKMKLLKEFNDGVIYVFDE